MGLSASQGRLLLLTARKSDLEFRAQQIAQQRLLLSQQLEEIAIEYENATSNRQMKISLALNGSANNGENVNTRTNLTYAALVSGTLANVSSDDSGIQAYDRTAGQEYASTTNYRLVDAYGAIVVSSVEEIPGSKTVTSNVATTKDEDGVYRVGTTTVGDDGESFERSGSNYILMPLKSDGSKSELLQFFADNTNVNKQGLKIDTKHGLVAVVKQDGTTQYYNYKTGEKADGSSFESSEEANLVDNSTNIPQSTKKTQENISAVEGSDGRWSLQENGVTIARYVVDETLKYGTTDVDGVTDGPNYLQECLRNGKYLLEKGSVSNDDGKFKWNSLSWDSAANITDSYYTEDDDAAKAKYDRLQTQIQNQDKKLELEQDNIETQRSAVNTEIESVDKVINENIESSFNAFG